MSTPDADTTAVLLYNPADATTGTQLDRVYAANAGDLKARLAYILRQDVVD